MLRGRTAANPMSGKTNSQYPRLNTVVRDGSVSAAQVAKPPMKPKQMHAHALHSRSALESGGDAGTGVL